MHSLATAMSSSHESLQDRPSQFISVHSSPSWCFCHTCRLWWLIFLMTKPLSEHLWTGDIHYVKWFNCNKLVQLASRIRNQFRILAAERVTEKIHSWMKLPLSTPLTVFLFLCHVLLPRPPASFCHPSFSSHYFHYTHFFMLLFLFSSSFSLFFLHLLFSRSLSAQTGFLFM